MYGCPPVEVWVNFSLLPLLLAGLGEFRIRDLNDEINKLLREKRHWQDRIIELGGPDYFVSLILLLPSLTPTYLFFSQVCQKTIFGLFDHILFQPILV